jgi:hypothetical protein
VQRVERSDPDLAAHIRLLGTTDLLAAGVTINNLQIYQDNMLSYRLQSGPWLAMGAYSPNGGVAGQTHDRRGTPVTAALTPVAVAGGPTTVLVPLGSVELPVFSGAGANLDARTQIVAVGVRHAF